MWIDHLQCFYCHVYVCLTSGDEGKFLVSSGDHTAWISDAVFNGKSPWLLCDIHRLINIIHNIFREIKDPNPFPFINIITNVKVSHSLITLFYGLHIRISIHLAKLLALDEILFHTAFAISFIHVVLNDLFVFFSEGGAHMCGSI